MDEMEEIIQDFIVEAEEGLENLDQCFIQLEEEPDNVDLLNDIFRSMHTIKGTAGFLGFNKLVEVAHSSESVLNQLRQGILKATTEIIDVILESKDIVKLIIDNIKNGSEEDIDVTEIKSKLDALYLTKDKDSDETDKEKDKVKEETKPISEPEVIEREESSGINDEVKEVVKPTSVPEEKASKKKEKREEIGDNRKSSGEQTVRVEANRLDQVMNLVGELVLNRNRLIKLSSVLEEEYEDEIIVKEISDTVEQLSLVTTDLQLAVMKTRMIPIKKVLNKFPRMVRDLSKKVSKKVNLSISGEDTELDKSVIEEIGDPLVHLIRNSIDHGIELSEERIAKGKPEHGTIKLSANQEGSNIVIAIEDDGKGMDQEKIKKKAIERGIIDKKKAVNLSEEEMLNLIFLPGFSTAEKTTDISGRGVGMDVVKTNITKINGIVEIKTKEGEGTKIIIKLPLTIAIIQALMVLVGKDIFAIPLSSVIEIVRISSEKDIKTINGMEVLNLRDKVLPILKLNEEFNIDLSGKKNGDNGTKRDRIYVIIIGLGERNIGILVNGLYRQEEIVIKSMGAYLSDTKGISGATITGDGKVVLILDIGELLTNLNNGRVQLSGYRVQV
ncbi:MAG: chemotaxis protein CheA [Nitrospirota bacterium]